MTATIDIRFVRNRGLAYDIVAWRAGGKYGNMPFPPTHVEWLTPQKTCVGQHGKGGGMREYPLGYDRDDVYRMADGSFCELVVSIPCALEQLTSFADFMRLAVIRHEPYDWSAPWGFLLGGRHHRKYHSDCSAKIILALRHCGVLRWPLSKPAHTIDPATAHVILSALVEVSHDLRKSLR